MTPLIELRHTPSELEEQVKKQFEEFVALQSSKKPGMMAFVGRGDRHSGRIVIMVGNSGNWNRGMTCFGDDARARAEHYVERYNRGI